jgi:hypothetical protein
MKTMRMTRALLIVWVAFAGCDSHGSAASTDDLPTDAANAHEASLPESADAASARDAALDRGNNPVVRNDAGGGTTLDASSPIASADAGAGPVSTADASTGTADAGSVPVNPPASGPMFPAIKDAWERGPFSVTMKARVGPARNATVFHPTELGKDGLKHPIVIWDNGAGQTGVSIYGPLVQHLASHGFVVYHAYESSDGGKEISDGLDWMIAENARSGGDFFGKLDPGKTAAMGHSRGSIATFAVAADPRLTTTLHLSGGTNPDIAEGHKTLPNLRNPAAFLCGEPGGDGLLVGDTASEWCAYDFEHATVPVFLTQVTGASHISAPGMMQGACAGWLRWRLMGDSSMKKMFAGPDCSLCTRKNWKVKQRDLDALP